MIYVREGPLLLRQAGPADAPVLHAWWNDGAVMAHAGFPEALESLKTQIQAGCQSTSCFIVCLDPKSKTAQDSAVSVL